MIVTDWPPACKFESLQLRAQLLADVRSFFAVRGVMEVETPLLSEHVGTDPNLNFFSSLFEFMPQSRQMYLQTSPEFAMKRLLASGSGSIYQICKAFRNSEFGRLHNPEFTLLEWYQVGYDLKRLMDEIALLMRTVLHNHINISNVHMISYCEIFARYTGLDALNFSLSEYRACAERFGLTDAETLCGEEHNHWLDYLFSEVVQKSMQPDGLYLVFHYPACLPSLARNCQDNARLVERVELFFGGIELGNGYFELADAEQQAERFEHEIRYRRGHDQPVVQADRRLLAALNSGLPDCAGMAIGLDRLLMLVTGAETISDVLAFPVDRA